jgi:hypothetical protein
MLSAGSYASDMALQSMDLVYLAKGWSLWRAGFKQDHRRCLLAARTFDEVSVMGEVLSRICTLSSYAVSVPFCSKQYNSPERTRKVIKSLNVLTHLARVISS